MQTLHSRRVFLKKFGYGFSSFALFGALGCNTKSSNTQAEKMEEKKDLFFKISLAQWSLHRAFESGELKAEDFAAIAKNQFNIEAVEYVAGFYKNKASDEAYFRDLNKRAQHVGVKNLLIMVDGEGELGDSNEDNRNKAVENHYKWVNAAKILECTSIRVNAFGQGSSEEVSAAVVDGLGKLATYAKQVGINVLIENHGNYSSNGKWVANVIQQVNMDNCGTLPDFGNFCTGKDWGSTKNNDCPEAYDRYLGMQEMMPFAKGVSAKTYDFDANGNETIIDFEKMLKIVKAANFRGHIGIEYEGDQLSESEGIRATKALLERVGSTI